LVIKERGGGKNGLMEIRRYPSTAREKGKEVRQANTSSRYRPSGGDEIDSIKSGTRTSDSPERLLVRKDSGLYTGKQKGD